MLPSVSSSRLVVKTHSFSIFLEYGFIPSVAVLSTVNPNGCKYINHQVILKKANNLHSQRFHQYTTPTWFDCGLKYKLCIVTCRDPCL